MSCFFCYTIVIALLQQQYVSTADPAPPFVGNNKSDATNTSSHFMYFAYGSNLLKERLHLNNPSATFVTSGKLKDRNLQFGYWKPNFNRTNSWHGGVATITEAEGGEVWGVVWRMNMDDIMSLDKQEGVEQGIYRPLEVKVDTELGEILCRTYLMNNFTAYLTSPPYKQVVCLGAKQNGLPLYYLKRLEEVETNDYSGPSILDDIIALNTHWKE